MIPAYIDKKIEKKQNMNVKFGLLNLFPELERDKNVSNQFLLFNLFWILPD